MRIFWFKPLVLPLDLVKVDPTQCKKQQWAHNELGFRIVSSCYVAWNVNDAQYVTHTRGWGLVGVL